MAVEPGLPAAVRGRSAGRQSPLDRPRLTKRLVADSDTAMTLVFAPAGYGKSTVLRQWQAADERPFVWISVDQRHDEATMLIGAIATELDKLEPLDERVFAPLMAPRPNLWNVVVPRLCDALQDRKQPFVLVIDDLHRVQDHLALEPLAAIAEKMPAGSQLAIASREDLAIPVGRLRTQRRVIELNARDLAMTDTEAERVLTDLGIELSGESRRLLIEHTEGWAAGLYLAALVLDAAADPDSAVEDFCGDGRMVAGYLSEEFVALLPVEHRRFLTEGSVLDRLSGPVCDQVLERQGSGTLLKELSRSNLLLTPLDNQDREYRLHGLLREMLAAELAQSDAALRSALNRRACTWFLEHDEVERAIPQAIESGDAQLAADLIWANTAMFESTGRDPLLQRWLAQFSDAQVAALPALSIARASSLTTTGDGAGCEHWIAVAFEALDDLQGPEAEALRLAGRVIRAAAAARNGIVAMREDVDGAYDLLPEGSPWRSLCCLIEGVSWHLSGDHARARPWLEEGARRGLTSAPNVGMLCLAQLSLLALDDGDAPESHRLADEAIAAADHFALAEDPTSAMALAAGALSLAQRGRPEEAKAKLRTADALLGHLNDFSAWYEAETRIVMARALMLLDDIAGARARLGEAGRFIQRTPDGPLLGAWAQVAWQEAEEARAVSGRWPLSPAELRLLHFLPTHLSYREIAAELFLSRNTVKSHSQAIYRKLGVSSRAEAVALARTAGLLDGNASPQQRPAG